jgi:hypothetical protein
MIMKTVDSKKLLLSLLREIVSAQHTVYHTAPIYEDDIDEMSTGGVVGAAPYHDLDENEEDVIEIVKRCKKSDAKSGKSWCLYSHKGKLLGRHRSAQDAYGQERAIKANS